MYIIHYIVYLGFRLVRPISIWLFVRSSSRLIVELCRRPELGLIIIAAGLEPNSGRMSDGSLAGISIVNKGKCDSGRPDESQTVGLRVCPKLDSISSQDTPDNYCYRA